MGFYVVRMCIDYEADIALYVFLNLEAAQKRFDDIVSGDFRPHGYDTVMLQGPALPGRDVYEAPVIVHHEYR
jgi:hypothetical protein